MEKSNEKIAQNLIEWYKTTQKEYDETVKLRDDSEELVAYMSLDIALKKGNKEELLEEIEGVEGTYKFANEWVDKIKESLERIEKQYKKITGRDIAEDLDQ